MLSIDAVLETGHASGFALWPVAGERPFRPLRLSGRLTPEEIGTAMAVLVSYNVRDPRGGRSGAAGAEDGTARVRRLLAAGTVVAPGGLRVRDSASGVTVVPGCCSGLEDWREWLDLLDGGAPWLGHDPWPNVEHAGDGTVRLRPDGGQPDSGKPDSGKPDNTGPAGGSAGASPGGPAAGAAVVLPLDRLPELLRDVRTALCDFLTVTELWADRYAPGTGRDLAALLDEALTIRAPLPDDGPGPGPGPGPSR